MTTKLADERSSAAERLLKDHFGTQTAMAKALRDLVAELRGLLAELRGLRGVLVGSRPSPPSGGRGTT